MRVFQTNKFAKTFKKLRKNEGQRLMKEVANVVSDPSLGVQKRGVLKQVWVYKFRYQKEQKLLAYIPKKNKITFISYGGHENFYRDISS